MISAGDVVVVDSRREQRRRAVVLSNARFHRLDERAMIVPEYLGPVPDQRPPWLVAVTDGLFAVNASLTVDQSYILETTGRSTAAELERVRRALWLITS